MPRTFFDKPLSGIEQFRSPCERLHIPAACKESFLRSLERWLIDHMEEGKYDIAPGLRIDRKSLEQSGVEWLLDRNNKGGWWFPQGMCRSKLGGAGSWENSKTMEDVARILDRLWRLDDGAGTTTILDENGQPFYRSQIAGTSNLVSSGSAPIAPIATMTDLQSMAFRPNGSIEAADGQNNFDDELSDIEAANDRSSDDDYGTRKSQRKLKPTRKAMQIESTSKSKASLDDVDDMSSDGFPPNFDRGRFPMQRRKLNSNKRRKSRSDKGIPKKRRSSMENSSSRRPPPEKRAGMGTEDPKQDIEYPLTAPARLNTALANGRPPPFNIRGQYTLQDITNGDSIAHVSESLTVPTPDHSPCPEGSAFPKGGPITVHNENCGREGNYPTRPRALGHETNTSNIGSLEQIQILRGALQEPPTRPPPAMTATPNSGLPNSLPQGQPNQSVSGHSTSRYTPRAGGDDRAEPSNFAASSSHQPQDLPDQTTSKGKGPAQPAVASHEEELFSNYTLRFFLIHNTGVEILRDDLLWIPLTDLFTEVAKASNYHSIDNINFTLFAMSHDPPKSLWVQSLVPDHPLYLDLLCNGIWKAMEHDMAEYGTAGGNRLFDVHVKPEGGLERVEEVLAPMTMQSPGSRLKPFPHRRGLRGDD